ncbi:MAG: hypothetical protein COA85_11935 [Robiginitomaculum sp.]|nr:MAG: hypothetical protein COA85_11935 [Robiginitomaculum sp.]
MNNYFQNGLICLCVILVGGLVANKALAQDDRDAPSRTIIIKAPDESGQTVASFEGEMIDFKFVKWVCNADNLLSIYNKLTRNAPFPGMKERVEYCRKRHHRGAEFSLCVTSDQPDALLNMALVRSVIMGLEAPEKATLKGCYTWDELRTVRKVLVKAAKRDDK